MPEALGAFSSAMVVLQSILLIICAAMFVPRCVGHVGKIVTFTYMERAIMIAQALMLPLAELLFVWGDTTGLVVGGAMTTSTVVGWAVSNALINLVLLLAFGCIVKLAALHNYGYMVASVSTLRAVALVFVLCDRAFNEVLGIESIVATAMLVASLVEMGFCFSRAASNPAATTTLLDSENGSEHEVRQIIVGNATTPAAAKWFTSAIGKDIEAYSSQAAGDNATPPETPKQQARTPPHKPKPGEKLDYAADEHSGVMDDSVPLEVQNELTTTDANMARMQIMRTIERLDDKADPLAFMQQMLQYKARTEKASQNGSVGSTNNSAIGSTSSDRRQRTVRKRGSPVGSGAGREHVTVDAVHTDTEMSSVTLNEGTTNSLSNATKKQQNALTVDNAEISGY